MMFTILQVSYTCGLASQIIFIIGSDNYSIQLWHALLITFYFYWGMNLIAHSIFALKIWVLSQKIKQMLSQKIDRSIEVKGRVLMYIQLVSVPVCLSFGYSFIYNPMNIYTDIQLVEHSLLINVPGFTMTSILGVALYSMQPTTVEEYSVSKSQIAIQFLSNLAFTLSDFISYALPLNTKISFVMSFVAILMNIFGLTVLTWTLCSIADL